MLYNVCHFNVNHVTEDCCSHIHETYSLTITSFTLYRYHSAGKHDRAFFFLYYYTPFTNYPHLLLTPIYYLPPFIIYPHLLFTPIYYIYRHLLFTLIYYLPLYYYTPFTIFRALRLIGSRSEGLFLVQNILI